MMVIPAPITRDGKSCASQNGITVDTERGLPVKYPLLVGFLHG
jgi:hypothetical protein